ncbi:hypothetical protein BEN71_18710 [Acinetobacter wuhouensis]|uniref:NF045616 family extracytoplasmic (lipo)protein n=1 Tax=Acinetobacter TaxID=469 RepID=UPI00083A9D2E|nr:MULTISPECIES: NF045616 family extracytoplasmic (lipo)protein [Acinetobacter]AXQ23958.1 hypothetical protein BEN71_18710 [Acinetobacter wuhouensis]RZG86964.1 hypothetical protein EXE10_05435 [Acinetobacter sp. WCHAc060033]
MNKQYILLISLLLAPTVNANLPRTKPLFAQMKNNQLCIFIQDDKASLGYENRAYVYTTNLDELSSRSDDYEKIYYNIEIPKGFKNCISIPLDHIERNKPHDIFIELDKTYSFRICISDKNQIYRVDQSQKCSNELYEVKEQKAQSLLDRIFAKIKEILARLFG